MTNKKPTQIIFWLSYQDAAIKKDPAFLTQNYDAS